MPCGSQAPGWFGLFSITYFHFPLVRWVLSLSQSWASKFCIYCYFYHLLHLLALLCCRGMASLAVHRHGLKLKSESGIRSPKYMSQSNTSSSEDLETSASSPKSEQKSCLCSATTHEGSFRCRLHRSSSSYWGKKPMLMPKPTPTANGVIHESVEAQ